MPKEGINIYFTIRDGASQVLSSIGDKTKSLDKETQSLAQAMAAMDAANKPLISRQTELKAALEKSASTVKDAKKAFRELGDEASKLEMTKAIEEQGALRRELIDVEGQIKSNHKALSEYREALRKSAIQDVSVEDDALFKRLSSAGLIKVLGDSLSQSLSFGLESALGQPLASAVNSIASGAVSGFALGGLPGLAVGALAGGVSGMTQIYKAKDDAYKEYYGGLYDTVNEATDSMISTGSVTAGSREQTQKAFAKRLGGDAEADDYLQRVETMAARTNYAYDEITGYSKLLLNTYNPEEVFGVLQSLSDATAGLSLSSSDVGIMISGLSRMRTTGKTTMEYLNYFSERGVDVYTALADALGVDKSGIAKMVSEGKIGGEFSAQAILDYIDREYGGLSEDLMTTYEAMANNLEDVMTTINAAGGEGYNATRKSGLAAETEAYSGALGEAVAEVNRISGENKAYLENLSEQYQREALAAVLLGEGTTLFDSESQAKLEDMRTAYEEASAEYASGNQEAGLDMEKLAEEAKALATAAYESSSQYQNYMDTQLDQIAAIRENTAGLAVATNAYLLSQERSKGLANVTYRNRFGDAGNRDVGIAETDYSVFDVDPSGISSSGYFDVAPGSFAMGINRVPYDNFPALLHKDERVLTASDARMQDAGGRPIIYINVTGNSFSGGTEEMAEEMMEIVAGKLEQAAILAVR